MNVRKTVFVNAVLWKEVTEEAKELMFPSVSSYIVQILRSRHEKSEELKPSKRSYVKEKNEQVPLPRRDAPCPEGWVDYRFRVPANCPHCGIDGNAMAYDAWGGELGPALWVSSESLHLFGCRSCGTQDQKMEVYTVNMPPDATPESTTET